VFFANRRARIRATAVIFGINTAGASSVYQLSEKPNNS
jgi:hypothetical protein